MFRDKRIEIDWLTLINSNNVIKWMCIIVYYLVSTLEPAD